MQQISSGDKKPDMLSVNEVAVNLGISRWTVNRLLKTGQLRSGKIGKRRLVLRRSLEEFKKRLEEQELRLHLAETEMQTIQEDIENHELEGGSMEQQSANDADMLTVDDVHEKLQVSVWMVRQLISTRQLASVKIGKRRLIPRHALEVYERQLEGTEEGQ